MLLHADIKGIDLPPRTLCLTYDDGPGRETKELAQYLAGEGICATFFVIGRHAEERPDALASLSRLGHIIGNHSYGHPGLVSVAGSPASVVREIELTNAIIRPYVRDDVIFFRAPYGNWREVDPATGGDKEQSIVADILNRSGRFAEMVGPVNWDISAEDFAFWRRGDSAEAAAAAYLNEINEVGRGIVLLHDGSDEELIRRNNRTFELTVLLVPKLRKRGYQFVPLSELPQVQAIRGELQACSNESG